MHNIYATLRECKKECEDCGIYIGEVANISVNHRAQRRWGQCTYKEDEGCYYIDISYKLVDDSTPIKALKETILHELCHTVEDGHGHKGGWLKAATILNETYGYNIKRTNSSDDKGIDTEKFPERKRREKQPVKYIFVCEDCGTQINRTKISDFVKNTDDYRCGKCGGKFKRIR